MTLLSVAPPAVTEKSQTGVINWHYSSSDNTYYLFLPAEAGGNSLDELRLWFTADAPVKSGSTELVSGELTDLFADGEETFTCGNKSYHVVAVVGASNIGMVFINTESGSLDAVHADKEYKEPGEILVIGADGNAQYDGDLSYIKGRGNSTWKGDKKPYNIKLDGKADLFGMGSSKKWCLLAGADETFMRIAMAYDFAQAVGVETTSDTVPVSLYVNGNYMGSYILTEKVEIGKNRVDIYDLESEIEELNTEDPTSYPKGGVEAPISGNQKYVEYPNEPENVTGGYLLELEKYYRYWDEATGFLTKRGQTVVVKSPEYASKAAVEYISTYYQEFENALYSPDGYNSLGKHYSEYIDVDSLARMYIVQEFGQNFDGCSSSFYLSKDVDGKLVAGPAWDLDLTFGSTSGLNTLINRTAPLGDPESLYIQTCFIDNRKEATNALLAQAFTHEDFQAAVQRIWREKAAPYYDTFMSDMSAYSEQISDSVIMNKMRWSTSRDSAAILSSFNSSVSAIRRFADARFKFLSEAYAADSYFVKYNIGSYGAALVFDTNIYKSGDTATVLAAPESTKDTKCFMYWSENADGTGAHFSAGDTIKVTGNTTLYAQWKNA